MTKAVTTRDPGGPKRPNQEILEGETVDPALSVKTLYSRSTLPFRRRMIIAVLLMALPTAVFWSTIFYHYGFRDDYSIIQEADDEPGKVFQVCAGYARPSMASFWKPPLHGLSASMISNG